MTAGGDGGRIVFERAVADRAGVAGAERGGELLLKSVECEHDLVF